jgi:hypothetical protein
VAKIKTEMNEHLFLRSYIGNLKCYDCGRLYGEEHGFPDFIVPNSVWRKISPTGTDAGLLCPSCICKRVYDAGISSCPGEFKSGPFVNRELIDIVILQERIEELERHVFLKSYDEGNNE